MRRLLLINPNTSTAVSARLHSHAQAVAGPQVQVHTATARLGAPYIACEASYAVAGYAVLDAWALALAQHGAFDAVLIACFGDPGLMALKACSPVPVTGLAEAAFVQAAHHGPFAIVTGGARWKPMLERLAHSLGYAQQLAGIHTVAPSGAELARDPVAAQGLLRQACAQGAAEFEARSVILGGAGLVGMAAALQAGLAVPLIDSVSAGVQHALTLPAPQPAPSGRFDLAWQGLGPELAALGLP